MTEREALATFFDRPEVHNGPRVYQVIFYEGSREGDGGWHYLGTYATEELAEYYKNLFEDLLKPFNKTCQILPSHFFDREL